MNVNLPSNDHLDKGENLSEAREGETMVKIASSPGLLDVHRSKVESSQQIIEKEVKTDGTGKKTKKKRKKSRRSTGENLPLVEMKDPNSDTFELTPMSTTLNDTTNEHTSYMKPMKGINVNPEKVALIAVDPVYALSNSMNPSLFSSSITYI